MEHFVEVHSCEKLLAGAVIHKSGAGKWALSEIKPREGRPEWMLSICAAAIIACPYCGKLLDEKQPEPIKHVSEFNLDTTPLKNAIEELDQLVREKGDMLNQLTAHGATLTININGGLLTVNGVAAKSSEDK